MSDHDDPAPALSPRPDPSAHARRTDSSVPGTHAVTGPPLSEELIADLHAGSLDADRAAQLWPTALADDEATRLLDALESVRGRLGALRGAVDAGDAAGERDRTVGVEPMPELVAARVRRSLLEASGGDASGENRVGDVSRIGGAAADAAALTGGSTAPATSVHGGRSRRRPGRRRLVASAAAVAAVGIGVAAPAIWAADGFAGGDTAVPVAAPDTAAPEPSATQGAGAPGFDTGVRHHTPPGAVDRPIAGPRGHLDSAKILSFRGSDGRGPFADPARLDACLTANDLPARAPLLGSGPVHVDGRDGTLLLVPGPHAPMLTALIVTPECGQEGSGLIDRTEVGG